MSMEALLQSQMYPWLALTKASTVRLGMSLSIFGVLVTI